MKKDFSEEAKQLADKVNKGCGIELKTVETIKDAKALDGIDAVIMCISSESTKYSEIIDIARLCGHCGKKIVGGVWLE